MDDKFGYEQMKSIVNQGTMEQQRMKEQEQYEIERANAEQVQYDTVREDAYNNRVNSTLDSLKTVNGDGLSNNYNPMYTSERVDSLLNSVKDRDYRLNQQRINSELDKERVQIEENINNRNADFFKNLNMAFEVYMAQPTHIEKKVVEPTLAEKIKDKAKKALPYIIAGSIAIGAIAGAYNVFTQPEVSPSDNSFHPNSIEDVIEYRDQQVESGITTHPEHVINDHSQKAEEERVQNEEQMQELREQAIDNSNESDSMREFVENENREKVIKIESGITTHPEHVIDDNQTKGGRGF